MFQPHYSTKTDQQSPTNPNEFVVRLAQLLGSAKQANIVVAGCKLALYSTAGNHRMFS